MIVHIQSIKSGGATTLALNLAVYHKQQYPDAKVAVCQVDRFPDVQHFCGIQNTRTWLDWSLFWGTDEWNDEVCVQIAHTYHGVDVFCSPLQEQWDLIDQKVWEAMVQWISKTYDVIYLDMPWYVQDTYQSVWLQQISSSLLILHIQPSSLELIQSLHTHQKILLNQCPKKSSEILLSFLKDKQKYCIGALPSDDISFWNQVYEHTPVVFHKRSEWTTRLHPVWEQIVKK